MKTVADYLRNTPKGTKLYSPICGDVYLEEVSENMITLKSNQGKAVIFNGYGCYHTYADNYQGDGECLLYPSKDVRDWSNYQLHHEEFKKGDILYHEGADCVVVFDYELDKSAFKGKHYYNFTSVDYTSDIVCFYSNNYKLASEADIERYREALESSGKRVLNSNTSDPIFKPFDKVVVRDEGTWHIDLFERYKPGEEFPYEGMHQSWKHCLPYNEETAKLIGTKDDYKGDYDI